MLNIIGTVASAITILVLVIMLSIITIKVNKLYNNFNATQEDLKSQFNLVQFSQYANDKSAQQYIKDLNEDINSINSQYMSRANLENAVTTDSLNINNMLISNSNQTIINGTIFSSQFTSNAHFANTPSALYITGNKKQVTTPNNLYAPTINTQNNTKAANQTIVQDTITMPNASATNGHVFAGGILDANSITVKNSLSTPYTSVTNQGIYAQKLNDGPSQINIKGNAYLNNNNKTFTVQNNAINIQTNSQDPSKYALQLHNGADEVFSVQNGTGDIRSKSKSAQFGPLAFNEGAKITNASLSLTNNKQNLLSVKDNSISLADNIVFNNTSLTMQSPSQITMGNKQLVLGNAASTTTINNNLNTKALTAANLNVTGDAYLQQTQTNTFTTPQRICINQTCLTEPELKLLFYIKK